MKGGLLVAGGSLGQNHSTDFAHLGLSLASLCSSDFVIVLALLVISKKHHVHGAEFISGVARVGPSRVVREAHCLRHTLKAIRVYHRIFIEQQYFLVGETRTTH